MTYRWILRSLDDVGAAPETVTALRRALNDLPQPLARTLVLRGIDTLEDARAFFRADRTALHDPLLMADMARAADRLAAAATSGETVLVYGDYDVDGTTATALMTHFLRAQGADAHFFVPDRFEDGYGLGRAGLDRATEIGAGVVVALDCGITAHEEARYARAQGLDLIVCDHHTPKATLPDAFAVLDPKRADCDYPFEELSGCGVGFKLVQATLAALDRPAEQAFAYLDLVGLSTASDIVQLFGENRILMREGLAALRATERPGIRALADEAGLDLARIDSTQKIVFTLGPRINAAGRLAHANAAVELLLADDLATAQPLAAQLEAINRERRAIDRRIADEAEQMARRHIGARNPHALVLYDPEWHLGVIGIVASRIVERFYRPTIMLGRHDAASAGDRLQAPAEEEVVVVKGSARSIRGVNVYRALEACEDVLTQFGGHDHAAGMSLPEAHVEALRERFDAAVGEAVTPEILTPAIEVDAPLDLADFDGLGGRFWAVLKQFGPFGPANPTPVFQSGGLAVAEARTVGKGDAHLKLKVRPAETPHAAPLDVIGFGLGEKLKVALRSQREGRPLELLYSLEENTWRGRTTLQLRARDLRLAEADGG